MGDKPRTLNAEFKSKVALAAIRGDKASHELAKEFGGHPGQNSQWKQQLLTNASDLFEKGRRGSDSAVEKETDFELHQIGKLNFEL